MAAMTDGKMEMKKEVSKDVKKADMREVEKDRSWAIQTGHT